MIRIQPRHITFFPPKQAAYLIGDFTDWDERPLPIHEALTLEFPEGAYIEYAFLNEQMKPIADEENPQCPRHPWYDYHRACFLPGNLFQKPPYVSALQGTITRQTIASCALEQRRICVIYEPLLSPVATLYIQDGEAFYHKLAMHEIADALISQGSIQPVRLVFIEPHDRVVDYWFNTRYEMFLLEDLLPRIEHVYGSTPQQGLWGASLGEWSLSG